MKRDQTKTIEAIDVSNISLQDYSVKVDYLPKKDLTPEEIGKFFSKFGRVHMVVLGTDVGALIGKHKARADLAAKLEFVVAGVARAKGQNVVLNELLANARLSMEKLEKKRRRLAQRQTRVVPRAHSWCLRRKRGACTASASSSRITSSRGSSDARSTGSAGRTECGSTSAPEASDILWENLGVTGLAAKLERRSRGCA